jgi:hypothetical protein
MPEISADKIIGKTLYAKKKLEKLTSGLTPIGTIPAGGLVGVVYSYIQRNGNVYWQFRDSFGNFYYVKHTADSFTFSGGVRSAFEQQTIEKEKDIIQQKGAIPFYIEKYGKWILGSIVAVSLFTAYLKNKK